MQTALQEIILALMSTLVSVMGGCVLTDWLTTFYIAYRRVAIRLEDESWLRDNCKDPIFFDKMRAHTTVCSDVEASARVGAFWIALQDVTGAFRLSWQPWVLWAGVALVAVVLLSCSCAVCGVSSVYRARRLRLAHLPVSDTQCGGF